MGLKIRRCNKCDGFCYPTKRTCIRSPACPFLSRRDVPMTSFNWVSAALINGKGTMVLSLSTVVVGPEDMERYFVGWRQQAAALFAPSFVGGRQKSAVSSSLCGSRRGGRETLAC